MFTVEVLLADFFNIEHFTLRIKLNCSYSFFIGPGNDRYGQPDSYFLAADGAINLNFEQGFGLRKAHKFK